MAELKNIRIAVSGIYDYAKEELATLRLSLEDAPEWVEDKPMYQVYRPACVIAKAVDMFKLLPLTHKHPPFPVDGVNFRDLAVGYTGENPRVDYVEEAGEVGIRSTMMMYDDEILAAYENGEIQLSPGYNAEFEWKKGKAPNGKEYDIIMKEITGVNHLALLPKGRGGEFAVVLDGAPETESESADMSIFEFIKIRNELAEYLESMDENEIEDAGKPDGSISHRKDGDYQKRGKKWYKVYESEGRGASIAAGHVARKIRNAQNVDELMEIVMSNTSRFTGKDGKLLPVVEKLQKAVNAKKGELNANKTKPEKEEEGQPKRKSRFPELSSEQRAQKNYEKALKEYKEREAKRIKNVSNLIRVAKEKFNVDIPESNITQEGHKGFSIYTKNLSKQEKFDIETALAKMSRAGYLGKEPAESNGGLGDFYRFRQKETPPEPPKAQEESAKPKTKAEPAQKAEPKGTPEAKTETNAPEKPAVLGSGRWNGKIYGNEKYGYRIYVDGNEKKISAAQKDEIEKYSSDKAKAEKKAHREAQNRNMLIGAMRVGDIAEKAEQAPKGWEKIKGMSADELFDEKRIGTLEKAVDKMSFSFAGVSLGNKDETKALVDRLKTDKNFREEMKTKFINSVEEVLNKRKERNENEKKVQEARNDRDSIVSNYIKEHGEPDFVKKGYWNGIVYGSPGRYSVYIGGRKKELTESEAKQFGL